MYATLIQLFSPEPWVFGEWITFGRLLLVQTSFLALMNLATVVNTQNEYLLLLINVIDTI